MLIVIFFSPYGPLRLGGGLGAPGLETWGGSRCPSVRVGLGALALESWGGSGCPSVRDLGWVLVPQR